VQIFGATYMVVAPEHPLLAALTVDSQRGEVDAYVAAAAAKSDLERTDLAKEKSGVQTGERLATVMPAWQAPVWLQLLIAQSCLQQKAPFGAA
jgi:leucyl-tRNA synthetase